MGWMGGWESKERGADNLETSRAIHCLDNASMMEGGKIEKKEE